MRTAEEFLRRCRFARIKTEDASASNLTMSKLCMRRNRRALSGRGPTDSAAEVWLSYDRGQVTIAAALEPLEKANPSHLQLLTGLVTTLDHLLSQEVTTDEATETWRQLETSIRQESRRRARKRALNLVLAILIILVGGFLLGWWLATVLDAKSPS